MCPPRSAIDRKHIEDATCGTKLIQTLKRALSMISRDDADLPVLDAAPDMPHERPLIRLAFFAPPPAFLHSLAVFYPART